MGFSNMFLCFIQLASQGLGSPEIRPSQMKFPSGFCLNLFSSEVNLIYRLLWLESLLVVKDLEVLVWLNMSQHMPRWAGRPRAPGLDQP